MIDAMSAFGTLRHFTATQHFRRFRIEADIDQYARVAGSVENDPLRKSQTHGRFAKLRHAL
jgi:hypothetical protein